MKPTPWLLLSATALIGVLWFASVFRDIGLSYKTAQNSEGWQTLVGLSSYGGRLGFAVLQTHWEGDMLRFDDGIHGAREVPNHGWLFSAHRVTADWCRPLLTCGRFETESWKEFDFLGFGFDHPQANFFSESSFRVSIPYYLPLMALLLASQLRSRRANRVAGGN